MSNHRSNGAYVDIGGSPLWVEEYGHGEPLLLLHGALGSTRGCFADLVPLLSQSRRVVAVDLQGHGHTPDRDRPLTYPGFAADMAALIATLKLGPTDVVGYSMGGATTIQLVIEYPHRVRRAVYAGGPCFDPGGYHQDVVDGFNQAAPTIFDNTRWHHEYLAAAPSPHRWQELVAKVNQLDRTWTGWTPAELQSIQVPVMLIAADSDIVRLDHVIAMFHLLGGGHVGHRVALPAARLLIAPGTTHVDLLTQVDLLHSSITSFLTDSPSTRQTKGST